MELNVKGIILLFLAISVFGISWRYIDEQSKGQIKAAVSQNLLPIALAVIAVALALFLSSNTNLKLL